jgi:hypothetical protein
MPPLLLQVQEGTSNEIEPLSALRTTKKTAGQARRLQSPCRSSTPNSPVPVAPPTALLVRPLCGPRTCGRAQAQPPPASKFLCWSALRGAQGRNCPTDTVIFSLDGPGRSAPLELDLPRRHPDASAALHSRTRFQATSVSETSRAAVPFRGRLLYRPPVPHGRNLLGLHDRVLPRDSRPLSSSNGPAASCRPRCCGHPTDARATVETRNRKPMRPNPLAPWELRVGDLRVYYDVAETPEPKVLIRAVGIKERNRVRIGRKELEL